MKKKRYRIITIVVVLIVALIATFFGCYFGKRGPHILGGESGAEFMERFDLNKDGKISHDEWETVKPSTAYHEKKWPQYDKNWDRFITMDEVPLKEEGSDAAPEDSETYEVTPKQIVFIGEYDKNGDMKVSKKEFNDPNFSKYDRNDDGYLEPHEAPKN